MKQLYNLLAALVLAMGMSFFISCANTDCVDNDGDGYGEHCDKGPDCNDDDPTVYPNAPELCDGKEHRCPGDVGYGQINEDCPK